MMNVWFQIVSIQFHPNLSQLQMDSISSSQTNTHHFPLLIIPTYHSHYSKNTYSATESWFTRKTIFHQSRTIVNNKCLFLLFLPTHSIQINKTTRNLSRRCLHTHNFSWKEQRWMFVLCVVLKHVLTLSSFPSISFQSKNSQSSLVLPLFITKLKHPNTARMWIVFCSWLIVFHSIIESEHTFILKTNNVDEFVPIHGIVFFVTWNVKHTNLLMFIINLLDLTQQTKLSQYISIPVQVKQELISIRKQLNQRTQRYSSSIKQESRIYIQFVQLLFSTKCFHTSLKRSHKNHIIVELVHESWDDEPVHPAVFMKCAYKNSLCPVKPQFWSVLVFKTTPNNSQQEELLWTTFVHNNHYSNNLS